MDLRKILKRFLHPAPRIRPPKPTGTKRLADFRSRARPLVGVAVGDLIEALAVLAASPDFAGARVIKVEGRPEGHLIIQTGHAQGAKSGHGKYALLRRTGTDWVIVEFCRWQS